MAVLFYEVFEDVGFGNPGLSRREVFTFDGFVHFLAVNGDVARRVYADLDVPGTDIENRYLNVGSYNQAFVSFSRKYQHPYYIRSLLLTGSFSAC